jgi:hypothetical protein
LSFQLEPFRAAWWLPGAHAQTIAGRALRPLDLLPLERERLDTPDGDFVDLDFAPEPSLAARNRPIALLLHGLEGSARRGYAYITYRELARVGIRGIGLNFRSCSGEPNRMPRFYHSGDTDDLRHVVSVLRARFGDRPLGAIGFSLGGNALLKYLGEEGEAAGIAAAVAISVPYDLDAGERHLAADPVSRVYVRHFLKSLQLKATQKEAALRERCDYDAIHRARSFREFDHAATAPLHGFDSAEDYYARSSSRGFLHRVRRPTLLIHALDDPFLPITALPHEAVRANPLLETAWTPHGGHVGFIGGTPRRPDFWAERQAARYLAHQLAS